VGRRRRAASGRLVTAVRRLEQRPGHLRVNTDQLLRTLAEEIAARPGGAPGDGHPGGGAAASDAVTASPGLT
jgi:hypothetical protein